MCADLPVCLCVLCDLPSCVSGVWFQLAYFRGDPHGMEAVPEQATSPPSGRGLDRRPPVLPYPEASYRQDWGHHDRRSAAAAAAEAAAEAAAHEAAARAFSPSHLRRGAMLAER